METEGELFRHLGYAEVRSAVRVLADEDDKVECATGVEIDGYQLGRVVALDSAAAFDADFVICARRAIWQRVPAEIARDGHLELRHTLSSLALVGDELWLESSDQLREDKFYRFNQTLQEIFNLVAKLPR
jgi:hypothetical protein